MERTQKAAFDIHNVTFVIELAGELKSVPRLQVARTEVVPQYREVLFQSFRLLITLRGG